MNPSKRYKERIYPISYKKYCKRLKELIENPSLNYKAKRKVVFYLKASQDIGNIEMKDLKIRCPNIENSLYDSWKELEQEMKRITKKYWKK